jgi:hypothetical protein
MKRVRGTTLIETLIAVVAFSFIFAALAMLIRGHVNLTRPLTEVSDGIHNGRVAFDILSREIRHISTIVDGRSDQIDFRAMISGSESFLQYRVAGGSLLRQENGGGFQEVVANALYLDFEYYDLLGGVVPAPVDSISDNQVTAIVTAVAVTLPDQSDTLVFQGRISPRNID